MFNWIDADLAVTRAQPAHHSAAAGLVRSSRSSASPAWWSCWSRCSRSPPASPRRCADSGSPTRALVMRSGADSEMTSGLAGPEVDIIKQAPGLRRGRAGRAGVGRALRHHRPAEEVDQHARPTCRCAASSRPPCGARRGVDRSRAARSQFGTNEVIVGRGASGQFAGLDLGQTITSGQNTWQVVGIFEADGGVAETEIWCDARVLQGAYRRGNSFQSVLARLDSADSSTPSATG